MQRYKTAVIGIGYIGNAHIEALQRIGMQICALADANIAVCESVAKKYAIPHVYDDYKVMLEKEELQAVHICTPNHLHFEIAEMALKQGLNVFCEKPLALTTKQSKRLLELADQAGVITATNYNYRYYPALQHARGMVRSDKLGRLNIITGNYLQDWLLYETDYNWRLEPHIGGASRAMADIGAHWCDLAQHISGLKITEVMADLLTVHKVRKRPLKEAVTFAKRNESMEYEDKPMTTEDYGGVMVRFENGAKGVFCVSQVSAGQKCRIRLELYGASKSVSWDHEEANSLWIGNRDGNNEIVTKSPTDMNEQGALFANYPAGHPEGYPSVVKNICQDFYQCIENGEVSETLPTFEDGHNQSRIVEAILKSNELACWVIVD